MIFIINKKSHVTFNSSPVEITKDDVAKEMRTTSGYENFMIDVEGQGLYDSKKFKVNCKDVKIHEFSSIFTQEITPRFQRDTLVISINSTYFEYMNY